MNKIIIGILSLLVIAMIATGFIAAGTNLISSGNTQSWGYALSSFILISSVFAFIIGIGIKNSSTSKIATH